MKQKILYIALLGCALCWAHPLHSQAQTDNTDNYPTIWNELQQAENFTVFSRLVEACGLQDTLGKIRDEAYEHAYQTGLVIDLPRHPLEQIGTIPQHRNYGYTLFAETDATWEMLIGKKAADITVADISNYLVGKGFYPQSTNGNNFTDESNIVNLFTTYHILPERLSPDKLVTHYGENGYYWKTSGNSFSVPVEEFYQTFGRPRLLKVYESAESKGIFLNRFPVLRNGRGAFVDASIATNNDYHESGQFQPVRGTVASAEENQGIPVYLREGENTGIINAVNGFLYPLTSLLVCTENVQQQLANQRMRFDVASLLPEMMNNEIRCPMSFYGYGANQTRGIPTTKEYPYFDNCYIAEGSQFYYFTGFERAWSNYQADEFNIIGKYDITLKLPPVPADGEYELRFGVSTGSNYRGIAQFYIGADKEHLQAAGLPIDLRIGGERKRYRTETHYNNIGWAQDSGDPTADRFRDLLLHEQGFMKGPNYFHCGNGTSSNLGRQCEWVLRRVVWRGNLEAGKTYYIRVKSCLDDETLQFYMDYIEWCPKNVYDNPETPEDIW